MFLCLLRCTSRKNNKHEVKTTVQSKSPIHDRSHGDVTPRNIYSTGVKFTLCQCCIWRNMHIWEKVHDQWMGVVLLSGRSVLRECLLRPESRLLDRLVLHAVKPSRRIPDHRCLWASGRCKNLSVNCFLAAATQPRRGRWSEGERREPSGTEPSGVGCRESVVVGGPRGACVGVFNKNILHPSPHDPPGKR